MGSLYAVKQSPSHSSFLPLSLRQHSSLKHGYNCGLAAKVTREQQSLMIKELDCEKRRLCSLTIMCHLPSLNTVFHLSFVEGLNCLDCKLLLEEYCLLLWVSRLPLQWDPAPSMPLRHCCSNITICHHL